MAIDPDVLALLTQSVTIAHWASQDKFGQPTYGVGVAWAARVIGKVQLVRDAKGQQVVSTSKCIVGGVAGTTVKDQVTLPGGTTPIILAVASIPDENGSLYETIYFA